MICSLGSSRLLGRLLLQQGPAAATSTAGAGPSSSQWQITRLRPLRRAGKLADGRRSKRGRCAERPWLRQHGTVVPRHHPASVIIRDMTTMAARCPLPSLLETVHRATSG